MASSENGSEHNHQSSNLTKTMGLLSVSCDWVVFIANNVKRSEHRKQFSKFVSMTEDGCKSLVDHRSECILSFGYNLFQLSQELFWQTGFDCSRSVLNVTEQKLLFTMFQMLPLI